MKMAAHNANGNEPSWAPINTDISPVKRLIEDCLLEVENGCLNSQPSISLVVSERHDFDEVNGYYKKVKMAEPMNGKECWNGLYISKTLTDYCQPTKLTPNGYRNLNKFLSPSANNLNAKIFANESHFPGFFNQTHLLPMLNLKFSTSKTDYIIRAVHDRGLSMHLVTLTRSLQPLPTPCFESPHCGLVYAWLMGASGGLFGLNHFRDETTLDALTQDRLEILLSSPTSPTSQLVTTAARAIDPPQSFTFKKGLGIDSIIGKIWSSKRLLNQQSCPTAPLVTKTPPVPNGRYRKTFLPKRHYKSKPQPKASGKGWVRVLVPLDSKLSIGQEDGKNRDTPPKGGSPPQYETRSFKRLKDQQNNKGAVPNFALEPVELGNSLDTLSTTVPSVVNASSYRGSSYDDVIESVILKLCHNGKKTSLAAKKKNDSGRHNSNVGLGSVSIKTEPNDVTNSDISESTPTPQVNEVGTPLASPSSIIPSRRTAKEEIPHFEHIDENIYAYDEEKSTDKSARKQAKRMICNCEPPVDSLSRDKADEKDVAMATTTKKDPALTAKVASLVSAIFTPKSGGCGPDCLNRLLMIECSNRCPCGDLCTNKQFQKRIYAQLEPFMTFTKGWGLRTLQDIEPGKFVIEYVGEVIDSKEFNKRQKHYHKDKRIHYYFMSLKQGQIIDATNKGSYSRFINHSCDPNCETQKWTVNGKLRIGIFAKRRIPKYSELTFDYQSQRYGREPQKCYCGSFNCRGYIDKNYLPTAAILPTPLPSDERTGDCDNNGSSTPEVVLPAREDPWLAEEMGDMLAQLNVHDSNGTTNAACGSSQATVAVDGMTDSKQIIRFCRLMVRTEKLELQKKLLQVLKLTRKDLLNIFINLQGLNLLWTWMTTLTNAHHDLEFKLELLDTLDVLPIQNRDTLERSKLPRIVEKWAMEFSREMEVDSGMHQEIAFKSQNLMEKWKYIKDVYKIPKKRDTNGYESCTSPYQPSPHHMNGSGQSLGEQHKISREEFDRGGMEKCGKLNGNNVESFPYESNRQTPPTHPQNHHPENLRRTSVEESKYYPSPSQTNLPYQGTTTPHRENRGEKMDDGSRHYYPPRGQEEHFNDGVSTSSNQCFHVNHLTPSPASLPKNNDSSAERESRYDTHKMDHARHRSSRDHRRESSHSSRRDEKGHQNRNHHHHHHHWSHRENRYVDDRPQHHDRERRYYRGPDEDYKRSSKRREDQYQDLGRSKRTHSDASQPSHKDRASITPVCAASDPRDRSARQQTTLPTTALTTVPFDSPLAPKNPDSNSAKSQPRNGGGTLASSQLLSHAASKPGLSQYPPAVFSPNFAQPRPSFPSFYNHHTSPLTSGFLPFNLPDPSTNASPYNMPPLARNLFMPTLASSNSLGLLGSTYHQPHHVITPQLYNNHSGGINPQASTMISPPSAHPQMPYFMPNLNNANYPSPMPMNGSLLDPMTTTQNINQPLDNSASSKTKKVKVVPQKLPKDWKTAIDASTGKPYYYHKITKQVQWDPPICNESDPEEQSSSTDSSSNSSPHSNTSPIENQEVAGADVKDRHQDSVKLKEKFRQELSAYVIQCLGPYHKKSCKVGRINSSEDFKYLARKLTHTVMAKELERNGSSIESLRLSTKMKAKTELYIEKYMEKLGANFVRPAHS